MQIDAACNDSLVSSGRQNDHITPEHEKRPGSPDGFQTNDKCYGCGAAYKCGDGVDIGQALGFKKDYKPAERTVSIERYINYYHLT
jgi:hypothetical protein